MVSTWVEWVGDGWWPDWVGGYTGVGGWMVASLGWVGGGQTWVGGGRPNWMGGCWGG